MEWEQSLKVRNPGYQCESIATQLWIKPHACWRQELRLKTPPRSVTAFAFTNRDFDENWAAIAGIRLLLNIPTSLWRPQNAAPGAGRWPLLPPLVTPTTPTRVCACHHSSSVYKLCESDRQSQPSRWRCHCWELQDQPFTFCRRFVSASIFSAVCYVKCVLRKAKTLKFC